MSTLIVSLMQKYTREERTTNNGESCEDFIQFRLFRILNEKDAEASRKTGQRLYANQLERCGISGSYINSREVTKRFRVAPGNYLIIPSCYTADKQGEFLLRLYTENPLGESNCCVLGRHKTEIKDEDVFFQNSSATDALFKSWRNLVGSGGSTPRNFVAYTKLYGCEAFINLHDKKDVTLYKRITKTLNRRF